MLAADAKVQYQNGNYNDLVSVPLVFFGLPVPDLFNPVAWLKTFSQIERQLQKTYPYDVVVLELGTDAPGQIAAFEKYLHVDVAVVTAIAMEHMEFFDGISAVAKEELSVAVYSDEVIINRDLCDEQYLSQLKSYITYGYNTADYQITSATFSLQGSKFNVSLGDADTIITANHESIARPQLYSLAAAAAVADRLGFSPKQIAEGFSNFKTVSGRLRVLEGHKGAVIIDDTYNASPEAARAALELLASIQAPQKIALLGNMNELGRYSKDAHAEVGKLCHPKDIDQIVTLGPDANKYLAGEAEKNGCAVSRFNSPCAAGDHIKSIMKPNAVILAKGSQNGVYAEEAVKLLLKNPDKDVKKLVRQSPYWLKKKVESFRRE